MGNPSVGLHYPSVGYKSFCNVENSSLKVVRQCENMDFSTLKLHDPEFNLNVTSGNYIFEC